MRELAIVGLSDNGRFVVAKDSTTGEQFRLSVDKRLTSLIDRAPSASSRSGQMEIPMESSLTPRDIQTRIRRGASVEEVAEAAGVTYEQAYGFAIPVLAERSHMVEAARATSVRRRNVGGTPVPLSELVDAQIAKHGVVPEEVTWDSWRREDGLWTITVTTNGTLANFVFDQKSRYVVADDEAARNLVGDLATAEQHEMALADVVADNLVSDAPVANSGPAAGAIHSLKEARDKKAQEQLDMPSELEQQNLSDSSDREEMALEESVAVPETRKPAQKPARRSVPSWDEIMFGGSRE